VHSRLERIFVLDGKVSFIFLEVAVETLCFWEKWFLSLDEMSSGGGFYGIWKEILNSIVLCCVEEVRRNAGRTKIKGLIN